MSLQAWPEVLRAAGIPVQLHNGWPNTPMPKGSMPDRLAGVFWHHDGSRPGDSPGGLTWVHDAYNGARPSAQIWVGRDGTWHFVGAGYASHAGVVRGGLTSANCVGVETDHTTGEAMSDALLDSMRRGLAAICRNEGRNSDFVTFHKIEASPRGRKVDPYFSSSNDKSQWDFELMRERAIIQNLINGSLNDPNISTLFPVPEPSVPAAPAPIPADWLRRGFTGSQVQLLQQRLILWNCMTAAQVATGPGIFGPATHDAVVRFQSQHGFATSGVVDLRTWERLHTNPMPPAIPPYPGRVLRRGMKGADVETAQRGLNRHAANLGLAALVVDGDFGPATHRMLGEYQKARSGPPFNLAPNGKPDYAIGPRTWPTFWQ